MGVSITTEGYILEEEEEGNTAKKKKHIIVFIPHFNGETKTKTVL
jgi:hypothetical protein